VRPGGTQGAREVDQLGGLELRVGAAGDGETTTFPVRLLHGEATCLAVIEDTGTCHEGAEPAVYGERRLEQLSRQLVDGG